MTDAGRASKAPMAAVAARQEWLARLFRTHYAELCSLAYGYVASYDIAEDLVQDLFMAVWADPERWSEDDDAIAVLLYVATRHRALDHLKGRSVRERYAERTAAEEPAYTQPTAPEALLHHEVQQAVDDAIATLPEAARRIFRLSRDEGLTYREIADHLQISVKTVETQMSRALKKLRATLAADTARFHNLAKVLRGRALLGPGRFADAAQAVAGVPTDYVYNAESGWPGAFNQLSGIGWSAAWDFDDYGVADKEGGNGLDFATANDPRAADARVDLLFRERAFWLFLSGHRLGDMRRLVTHHGRSAESVFPGGAYHIGGSYGNGTSIPFSPVGEEYTSSGVTGCTG